MMPNIWEEAKSMNEDMLNEDTVIEEAERVAKNFVKHTHHYTVLPKEYYYPEDDGLYDDLWEGPLP